MANFCRINVRTDKLTMEKIRKDYTGEDGQFKFTFEKIIPMPEPLKIESSTAGWRGLALIYRILDSENLSKIKEKEEFKDFYFPDDIILKCYKKRVIKAYCSLNMFNTASDFKRRVEELPLAETLNPKDYEKELELGHKYMENFINFDHSTWYTWACEKWGTWRDAGELQITNDGFSFVTVWPFPDEAMGRFTEDYPDSTFYFDFEFDSEEDKSFLIEMKNGVKEFEQCILLNEECEVM